MRILWPPLLIDIIDCFLYTTEGTRKAVGSTDRCGTCPWATCITYLYMRSFTARIRKCVIIE